MYYKSWRKQFYSACKLTTCTLDCIRIIFYKNHFTLPVNFHNIIIYRVFFCLHAYKKYVEYGVSFFALLFCMKTKVQKDYQCRINHSEPPLRTINVKSILWGHVIRQLFFLTRFPLHGPEQVKGLNRQNTV
jgi:hypothetical protein